MPLLVDRLTEATPQTGTKSRRRWFRFRFPWLKTATSAPSNEDGLLIVNDTGKAWSLHLGYRALGQLDAGERRLYRVVKVGMLSARQVDAPAGAEYLTLHIGPAVQMVEIVELVKGLGLYDMRSVEHKRASHQ